MSIPAEACSCVPKSEWVDAPGVISFDGRVLDVPDFAKGSDSVVAARLQVVRRIKGDLGSEVRVLTRHAGSMCGAVLQLAKARANGRTLEFHITPTDGNELNMPAGELRLSMCGVYPSELDPDPPRARR